MLGHTNNIVIVQHNIIEHKTRLYYYKPTKEDIK